MLSYTRSCRQTRSRHTLCTRLSVCGGPLPAAFGLRPPGFHSKNFPYVQVILRRRSHAKPQYASSPLPSPPSLAPCMCGSVSAQYMDSIRIQMQVEIRSQPQTCLTLGPVLSTASFCARKDFARERPADQHQRPRRGQRAEITALPTAFSSMGSLFVLRKKKTPIPQAVGKGQSTKVPSTLPETW